MYTTKWIAFNPVTGMSLRVREDASAAIATESRATLFDTVTEARDALRESGLDMSRWQVTKVNVIE